MTPLRKKRYEKTWGQQVLKSEVIDRDVNDSHYKISYQVLNMDA